MNSETVIEGVQFQLPAGLNVDRLAVAFRSTGAVQVGPLLAPEQARLLQRHLIERSDWRLILNSGDKVFELDAATQKAMSHEKRLQLEQAVHHAAARGFQYRFNSVRVPDRAEERVARDSLLDRFAAFLSSPPMLALLRQVTGEPDIGFADAQATRYASGDFLTAHDDEVAGKNRRAAYVYGLTEGWRPEWGGLLLFHGEEGIISRGFAPRYNVMTLFKVPQTHSVSMVAPFAAKERYSVTGWLRAGALS